MRPNASRGGTPRANRSASATNVWLATWYATTAVMIAHGEGIRPSGRIPQANTADATAVESASCPRLNAARSTVVPPLSSQSVTDATATIAVATGQGNRKAMARLIGLDIVSCTFWVTGAGSRLELAHAISQKARDRGPTRLQSPH